MSSSNEDPDSRMWVRITRWIAGVVAFGAGIAVLVAVHRLAVDGAAPWATWRETVRYDDFAVLVPSAAWLLLGALIQTPVALARRASVMWGWAAVAVIALWFLLLAAAAIPLSDSVPPPSENNVRRSWGAGDVPPMLLAFLLIIPVLYVLSGAVFRRTVPGSPGWRPATEQSRQAFGVWTIALGVSGLGALILLLYLVIYWLGLPLILFWLLVGGPGYWAWRKLSEFRERRRRRQAS